MPKAKYILLISFAAMLLSLAAYLRNKNSHIDTTGAASHMGSNPQPPQQIANPQFEVPTTKDHTSGLNLSSNNRSDFNPSRSQVSALKTREYKLSFRETSRSLVENVTDAIASGELHDLLFVHHTIGACLSTKSQLDPRKGDLTDQQNKRRQNALTELELRCGNNYPLSSAAKAVNDFQKASKTRFTDIRTWPNSVRYEILNYPDKYATSIFLGGSLIPEEFFVATGTTDYPPPPLPYLIFTAAMCDIGLPCGQDSLSYLAACTAPAPCGENLRDTARLRALSTGMNEEEFERLTRHLAEAIRTGRLNFKP